MLEAGSLAWKTLACFRRATLHSGDDGSGDCMCMIAFESGDARAVRPGARSREQGLRSAVFEMLDLPASTIEDERHA